MVIALVVAAVILALGLLVRKRGDSGETTRSTVAFVNPIYDDQANDALPYDPVYNDVSDSTGSVSHYADVGGLAVGGLNVPIVEGSAQRRAYDAAPEIKDEFANPIFQDNYDVVEAPQDYDEPSAIGVSQGGADGYLDVKELGGGHILDAGFDSSDEDV